MRKRQNKEDKTSKFIHRLKNILDENYFHICISIEENNRVEWKVYYNNLPNSIYFSDKNKALLTSEKNTTEDIYKLREKFSKEKKKEFNKNLGEYISVQSEVYANWLNIKRAYAENIINLMFIILPFNILNRILIKSTAFSLLQMVLTISLAIFCVLGINKIEKETKKSTRKLKEKFIQEKIRRQGLYFVNKFKE